MKIIIIGAFILTGLLVLLIVVLGVMCFLDLFGRCANDAARADKDADWEDYSE